MNSSKIFIGTMLGIIAIALFAFFVTIEQPTISLGDAVNAVNVSISTTTTVGPAQGATVPKTQIFAGNTSCKSRIISTQGVSAIMISFKDIVSSGIVGSTTVSGTIGHLQAASTTVVYPADEFGCGTWNAFGFASTTITTTELQ